MSNDPKRPEKIGDADRDGLHGFNRTHYDDPDDIYGGGGDALEDEDHASQFAEASSWFQIVRLSEDSQTLVVLMPNGRTYNDKLLRSYGLGWVADELQGALGDIRKNQKSFEDFLVAPPEPFEMPPDLDWRDLDEIAEAMHCQL